jgi:hypothetical protein
MAMKVGGEYKPDRVSPRHFDQLADDAKLSKAAFRRRVVGLARLTVSKLPDVVSQDQVSEDVAQIIRQRCSHVIEMFER